MIPDAAPDDDPLEQDAPDHAADDPAIEQWFLSEAERRNPATDLRLFSTGNLVEPLVDGRGYFKRLCHELGDTRPGDQVYFLDFRGDMDELLDGPGTEVGRLLGDAAERGVGVFGLLWRSQPRWMKQSEEANAELVRHISDHGGQVMLDARTRRVGSHHQKLVVIRHPHTSWLPVRSTTRTSTLPDSTSSSRTRQGSHAPGRTPSQFGRLHPCSILRMAQERTRVEWRQGSVTVRRYP